MINHLSLAYGLQQPPCLFWSDLYKRLMGLEILLSGQTLISFSSQCGFDPLTLFQLR